VALGAGSLKCVVATSGSEAVEQALQSRIGGNNLLRLHDGAFLVYTEALPSAIRDWLRPFVANSGSLLVVEFERWSGGGAIDRDWLTRRGH
jgi:hypothetical protein